jgi:hypothetical protein
MASKPLLLSHPNSLDTSPKWFWMVGKGIHWHMRLVWLLLDVNKSARVISLLGQNPGIQSPWYTYHCFSTIPIHLIHPQNVFGWLGRGSMGSKSCIRLVWLLLDVNKSACEISLLGQNPGVQSPYGIQTIASQPSQFTWYIPKMVMDGWEGNPWALSLASGWFGWCCWMSTNQLVKVKYHISLLGQNPARWPITLWHPNHCFSTIPYIYIVN